jgi:hypothetical protein
MRALAPLALLLALQPGGTSLALAQIALRGQVVDDSTEQTIRGARVLLINRYGKTIGYAVTDSLGHFAFEAGAAERLRLEAKALGYLPAATPVLWMVEDHEYAVVEIRLAPHAVLLAPIEIVALSPPAKVSPILENMEFRRTHGLGYRIGREEIEARHPARLSDMLEEVAGLSADRRSGPGSRTMRMSRTLAGPGGADCPVQIFLDGMLATRPAAGGDVSVDELVLPHDVEAIEIFRGLASVPAEFLNPLSRCGVIAIWTKRALPR